MRSAMFLLQRIWHVLTENAEVPMCVLHKPVPCTNRGEDINAVKTLSMVASNTVKSPVFKYFTTLQP